LFQRPTTTVRLPLNSLIRNYLLHSSRNDNIHKPLHLIHFLSEVVKAGMMDAASIVRAVVDEYLGERTHFRRLELHGNFRRISVCTYQNQPLYIVENKVWIRRDRLEDDDMYTYSEEIALRSSEGAALMLWEKFNTLELRNSATQKPIRTHDLVSLNLSSRPSPAVGNIGIDEFISFVKRYLDVIASSV
jgi:hypothetical protein